MRELSDEERWFEIRERVSDLAIDCAVMDLIDLDVDTFPDDYLPSERTYRELDRLGFHLGVPTEEISEMFFDVYRAASIENEDEDES